MLIYFDRLLTVLREDFLSNPKAAGQTFLYRYYDADGDLLYVGISIHVLVRHTQHVVDHWFGQAVTLKWETFSTREKAELAEVKAIKAECPRYNVIHSISGETKGTAQAQNKNLNDYRCLNA